MNSHAYAKCSCQCCGNHIEFPVDAAGLTINCPHCDDLTDLVLETPETPAPVEPKVRQPTKPMPRQQINPYRR